jgi:hypothetical protein
MQIHQADFSAEVKNVILQGEGNIAAPYFDRLEIASSKVTIGYGFNLEVRDNLKIALYELNILQGMNAATIESTLTQYLNEMQVAKATPLPQGMIPGTKVAQSWLNDVLAEHLNTLTQTITANQVTEFKTQPSDADAILNDIIWGVTITGQVIKGTVELLDAKLGNTVSTTVLPHDSKEYLALSSLFYNSPSRVTSELVNAIQTDHRADAWYLIRYESNGQMATSLGAGIANRRYTESDKFGLYDGPDQNNPAPNQAEAREVMRMYTMHHDEIRAYEAMFSPLAGTSPISHGIDFNLSFSRNRLITDFAEGRSIDGEVLVGKDDVFPGDTLEGTANGDLLFGEKGNDVLRGLAGTDVLDGGAGIDTLSGGADADLLRGEVGADSLQGGAGDDRLEGGAGFDTYYYTSLTDGHDTIVDSGGQGQIQVDRQLLVGGVKQSGETDWENADGSIKYRMSGTDLGSGLIL